MYLQRYYDSNSSASPSLRSMWNEYASIIILHIREAETHTDIHWFSSRSKYNMVYDRTEKRISLYNFVPNGLIPKHSNFSIFELSKELDFFCSSSMPGNCRTGSNILRTFWARNLLPQTLRNLSWRYFVCQDYIMTTSCWSLFFLNVCFHSFVIF